MLSPLHHLTIGHDNSGLGSGWYCEKVAISHALSYDFYNTTSKFFFFTQNWVTGYALMSSDFSNKVGVIVFMLQTSCVYVAAWDFIDSSSYHC